MREALKEEIAHELSEAVANVIRRMGSNRTMAEGRRAMRQGMETASRYAHDLADDARGETRRLVRTANRELREHPIAAFGAGLALGALIGMLVAQHHDDAVDS
jgi:ElaB/YqjD/DUF883 family membrane-anchored ribosome-binding protein